MHSTEYQDDRGTQLHSPYGFGDGHTEPPVHRLPEGPLRSLQRERLRYGLSQFAERLGAESHIANVCVADFCGPGLSGQVNELSTFRRTTVNGGDRGMAAR